MVTEGQMRIVLADATLGSGRRMDMMIPWASNVDSLLTQQHGEEWEENFTVHVNSQLVFGGLVLQEGDMVCITARKQEGA